MDAKFKEAIELIQYFVDRVEAGTIRSRITYGKYKDFLDSITYHKLTEQPRQEGEVKCKICNDEGWIIENEGRTSAPCPNCGCREKFSSPPSQTLDREKVKEILKSYFLKALGINIEAFWDHITDAICSLAVPTLSEEEIEKLWNRFSFEMVTVDDHGELTGTDVKLMTKPEFELAIKELTKKE
jgi:hypothetical protein